MGRGNAEGKGTKREEERPFRIFISKNGNWYYNGQEIIHERVLKFLSLHLRRNSKGKHYIAVKGECRSVDVEETPLVICIVSHVQSSPETLRLILNDGSEEILQPDTLTIDDQDNIYCWVREKKLEARFKRTGYIELAKYLQYDDAVDRYYLPLNAKRHYLRKREKDDNGIS